MSQDIDHSSEESDPAHGRRPQNKLFAFRRPKPVLITDAERSPLENWEHRKRVYAILQGSRVPFLLASAVTYMWMHNLLLSAILFAISIPLPWIAVVIANGKGEPKDPRAKQVYKPQAARAQIAQQQLQARRKLEIEGREGNRDSDGGHPPAIIDHE